MAASTSLASELMETLTPDPSSTCVGALISESAMSSKVMQSIKTALKDKYEFDSEIFRARNGTPKPTGMLELFGKYSGDEADTVCKEMIIYAHENKDSLSVTCKESLDYQRMSFNAWIAKHSLKKSICDEIALYVLCRLYSRHAIVYTTNKAWTTLHHEGLTGSEIEKRCDLVLNHTEKGLVLCKKLEQNDVAGTPDNDKRKKKTRTMTSIHKLLEENQERERERANKVSAKLSVTNILPDERTHNTRHTTPLRCCQNMRDQRASCANKNYSDNLDEHHLDIPPNKKSKS